MRILLWLTILIPSLSFSASIWHIDGKHELYLFGTIHVLKPNTYPLADVYDNTLAKCDALWIEADLGEMEDADTANQVRILMALPEGQSFESQLSTEAYQSLELLAEKAGLPLMMLHGLKPWAVANLLTVQIFKEQGFEVERGLDVYLQSEAVARGIPVNTFETVLWQLQLFDDIANTQGDKFIQFSTSDMDDIDTLVNNMYRYWQQGDVEALYEQAKFEDYRSVEKAILIDRNKQWLQLLDATQSNKTQCVAVGALHMASKNGLLAQYRARGYKIQQLN